jgi:hypothetical protein
VYVMASGTTSHGVLITVPVGVISDVVSIEMQIMGVSGPVVRHKVGHASIAQDLSLVMTSKAEGIIQPVRGGIVCRPRDIEGLQAIYRFQPVAGLIVVLPVCVGPMLIINMVITGIMACQALNGCTGHTMTASVVRVDIRSTHATADRGAGVMAAHTPLFFARLQHLATGIVNPQIPVGLGHGYPVNNPALAMAVVAFSCVGQILIIGKHRGFLTLNVGVKMTYVTSRFIVC